MRRRWTLLPVGLVLLAAAEITVFVLVADLIGTLWTVLLMVATGLAGSALLRREGTRGFRAFRAAVEAGRPPGPQVSDAMVGVVGAGLLALPGLLSSAAGVLLLMWPGRRLAARALAHAAERRLSPREAGELFGPRRVRVRRGDPAPAATGAPDPPGAVVEGEVVEGEIVR